MGLLHAHAVTKAIQRANKLDVASEVRWARAIGLKKVCSLMRSKREPHYPRTCEQGSAEAMAVLHVMLSTLKRRHPTAQTRVSLCATCTGPCGTTDVADAGGATSLQDRGLPTSYKATSGPGRMLIIAWHGAVLRNPCSRCKFSVMRASRLAQTCAMRCAQLFSVWLCVLFVWSGPVPTDQNSIYDRGGARLARL